MTISFIEYLETSRLAYLLMIVWISSTTHH